MAPDAVVLEDGLDIFLKAKRGGACSLCRSRHPLLRAKLFLPGIFQLLFSLFDFSDGLSDQVSAAVLADIRVEGFDRQLYRLDVEVAWGENLRRVRIKWLGLGGVVFVSPKQTVRIGINRRNIRRLTGSCPRLSLKNARD